MDYEAICTVLALVDVAGHRMDLLDLCDIATALHEALEAGHTVPFGEHPRAARIFLALALVSAGRHTHLTGRGAGTVDHPRAST